LAVTLNEVKGLAVVVWQHRGGPPKMGGVQAVGAIPANGAPVGRYRRPESPK
jgi:hypothetical protein